MPHVFLAGLISSQLADNRVKTMIVQIFRVLLALAKQGKKTVQKFHSWNDLTQNFENYPLKNLHPAA